MQNCSGKNKAWQKCCTFLGLLYIAWFSTSAFAGVRVDAAVVSEYLFRGLVQSAEEPAFQLGLDYLWGEQNYAGAWVSRVETTAEGNIETNFYAGKVWQFRALTLNSGFILYEYHQTSSTDDSLGEIFTEAYWERLTVSWHEGFSGTRPRHLGFRVDIPQLKRLILPRWDLILSVGYQEFDPSDEYSYMSLSYSREFAEGITLGFEYSDARHAPVANDSHYLAFIRIKVE